MSAKKEKSSFMCTLFLLGETCRRRNCNYEHKYVRCRHSGYFTEDLCKFVHFSGSDEQLPNEMREQDFLANSVLDERKRLAKVILSDSKPGKPFPCTRFLTTDKCWYKCHKCVSPTENSQAPQNYAKCTSCRHKLSKSGGLYYFSLCNDVICGYCQLDIPCDSSGAVPMWLCPACKVPSYLHQIH